MLEELKRRILSCRDCEDNFGFEPHPVFWGNENAKIMQISQAPSRAVHTNRRPFDDVSGKILREKWYRVSEETFYNPDNFYLTDLAHCYPGKAPRGGDRTPPKHCAEKWLMLEMQLVNNEIFLLVGGKAAEFFFPKRDFSELVFKDERINGKPAFVLPHSSPLNVKWFKDHPDFLASRVKDVEKAVHETLQIP